MSYPNAAITETITTVSKDELAPVNLNVNELVLVKAMYEKYKAPHDLTAGSRIAVNYTLQPNGQRKLRVANVDAGMIQFVVNNFRNDPKSGLAACRGNMINIMRDTRLLESDRKDRLSRYLDAMCDLNVKLDRRAFPADPQKMYNHVPEYIPDGLSDLGGDPNIDPAQRSREKIRVDKKAMMARVKPALMQMIETTAKVLSPGQEFADKSEDIKMNWFQTIASFIHTNLAYDYAGLGYNALQGKRSIMIHEYWDEKIGVCRHHGMVGQLMAQFMGLTSQLYKCNVVFGSTGGKHAANLIRVNNSWHLMDITNPETIDMAGNKRPFIKELNEFGKLARRNISYVFEGLNGEHRSYTTNNTMYYRILDNRVS